MVMLLVFQPLLLVVNKRAEMLFVDKLYHTSGHSQRKVAFSSYFTIVSKSCPCDFALGPMKLKTLRRGCVGVWVDGG